jgi:hypothetical protein
MTLHKKTAITVGVLFLVALIFNLIASGIIDPILDASDYLNKAFPQKTVIIIGNVLNVIAALAMIFIPIALIPVIKKQYLLSAFSYIVFRALEGILFIYMVIKSLTFISLSKTYIHAATEDGTYIQTLADSIHLELHWATVIYIIIFALGAMIFYHLLFKSRLIPRFFSVWEFLAALLLFIGALLGLLSVGIFNQVPIMEGIVYFAPPIALNEFVIAIWLIVKGFNPEPIMSQKG